MELPKRRSPRLKDYDYSRNGAYFVTICTKNKQHLFGPVGADPVSARMVERTFLETIARYEHIDCPIYVVMPNHFHAIITIVRADMESAPTISRIIQSFKRYSTLEYMKLVRDGVVPPFDKQIWQRSFYDHIIRDKDDYDKIATYIRENPLKWKDDCFYYEGECDATQTIH